MKEIPQTQRGYPAIPLVARDLRALQEFSIQYYDNTLCSETVPASLINYLELHDKLLPNRRNQKYSTIVYNYVGEKTVYRERRVPLYLMYDYFLLHNSKRSYNSYKTAIFTGDDLISQYFIGEVNYYDSIKVNPLENLKDITNKLDLEEKPTLPPPRFLIDTTFPIIKFHSICLYNSYTDERYDMCMQITKHILILRDDFPYHLSLINLGLSNQHHRNLIFQRVQETLDSKSTKPSSYSDNTFRNLLEGFIPEEDPNLYLFRDFIYYSIWYLDGCPKNVPKYGELVYNELISSQSSANPLISKSSFSALSFYYFKLLHSISTFLQDF